MHEINVFVGVQGNEAKSQNAKNDTDQHAGHDGILVVVADFTDVSAGGEGRADDVETILERVDDGKDVNEIAVDKQTQQKPSQNRSERKQGLIETNLQEAFHRNIILWFNIS